MARPVNPQTGYRIKAHVTCGHVYASTQRMIMDTLGILRRRHVHWGVLQDNKFTPWANFLALSATERSKFIFPKDWDLSTLTNLADQHKREQSGFDYDTTNRLYGDIWLLEQITEKIQLRHDLQVVFKSNDEIVKSIITLAMFLYLTKFNYHHVERWQRNVKSPCDFPLSSKIITTLTKSITEQHRSHLLKLWSGRFDKKEICAVDSSSRSHFSDSLEDVRWNKSKELLPLDPALDVVLYSLSTHMPIYYRTFPDNMPNSESVDVIMTDLKDAKFKKITFITNSGYDSLENIGKYVLKGHALLTSVNVEQEFIMAEIRQFKNFEICPDDMVIDCETELYFRQYDLNCTLFASKVLNKKADSLKLNLYLDTKLRSAILRDLRIAIDKQKLELDKLLAQKAILEYDTVLKKHFCYFKIKCDRKTRKIQTFKIDATKVAKIRLLAGFFANVTNKLDFDAITAYHHYKLHDEQQKYFEQTQEQMIANHQRCWTEKGKSGRQLILFVALILSSYVQQIWRTKLNKQFSSPFEVLDEMRSIRCIEYVGHEKKITPFLKAQLNICKAFDLDIPKECIVKYASLSATERKSSLFLSKKVVMDSE